MARAKSAETKPVAARGRENTRERLLRAGRRLFFTRDFTTISVELVAREAELTRAAFYLHFASKDDLLAAIMIAESRQRDKLFHWFDANPPSRESIDLFLRAAVGTGKARSVGRLFHIAALQSDAARAAFLENRLRYMSVLAVGFPAFAPPRDESPQEQRRFARAMLLAVQREQLTVREKHTASAPLLEQMIIDLREQMLAFHHAHSCG